MTIRMKRGREETRRDEINYFESGENSKRSKKDGGGSEWEEEEGEEGEGGRRYKRGEFEFRWVSRKNE